MTGFPLRGPPTPMKPRLYLQSLQSQQPGRRSDKFSRGTVFSRFSDPSVDATRRTGRNARFTYGPRCAGLGLLRKGDNGRTVFGFNTAVCHHFGDFTDPELLIARWVVAFKDQRRIAIVRRFDQICAEALSAIRQDDCSADMAGYFANNREGIASKGRDTIGMSGLPDMLAGCHIQRNSLTAPGPCGSNDQTGQRGSLKPIEFRLLP